MLSFSIDASASPQHQQNSNARQNLEKRRFQIQEFRLNRRLERQQENQGKNNNEREPVASRKDLLSNASASNGEDKPVVKYNRLSPEERIALRRQIKEARQDIYLRQQEKN